jgi:antitoxin MazE
MKTKLEKIGDSRGVCIPESLIEEAGLDKEEIELQVVNSGILIKRTSYRPREGWAEAARLAHERGDDVLLWENPEKWVWD